MQDPCAGDSTLSALGSERHTGNGSRLHGRSQLTGLRHSALADHQVDSHDQHHLHHEPNNLHHDDRPDAQAKAALQFQTENDGARGFDLAGHALSLSFYLVDVCQY